MFQKITLDEITAGLDYNLNLLEKATFVPTPYSEFLSKVSRGAREVDCYHNSMTALGNQVIRIQRFISSVNKQFFGLQERINDGLQTGVAAYLQWKKQEYSFWDNHIKSIRKKTDLKRAESIKKILGFECYTDAQIALQHTDEFSNCMDHADRVNYSLIYSDLVTGYHADGEINFNFMRLIKEAYGITLEYNKLKKRFEH